MKRLFKRGLTLSNDTSTGSSGSLSGSGSASADTSNQPIPSRKRPNFWLQVSCLCRKDYIIFRRSWWWTFFRAYLLPLAFIIFMGEAKHFFVPYSVYGVSDPTPIKSLIHAYGGMDIAYYAKDGLTDTMKSIMNTALAGIPENHVYQLDNPDDIYSLCHENLQGSSKCYGAVQWNSIDEVNKVYNYTIRANSGLSFINIASGDSANDIYVMPLQWAVEKAIGGFTDTPSTMPYTSKSQNDYLQKRNEVYMKTVAQWLAPALFLSMIGVVYHVSGMVAQERESGMSSLLSSMGVSELARLLSVFLSFSSVYIFGWVLIGLIFSLIAFTEANVAISIFYHIFSGFSLVSYAIFLGNLFKSAQLSGIISSGVSVVLALMTTVQSRVQGGGPYQTGAIYALSWLFPPCNYAYFNSAMAYWQRQSIAANMVRTAPGSNIIIIIIFVATIFQIFFFFSLALVFEKFAYDIKSHPMSIELNQLSAVEIRNLTKIYKIGGFFRWGKRKQVVAVDNLDLNIGKGQIVSLLGANGSGKTTTLEMLSGIQPLTSGQVMFHPDAKIGICPQKNILWDKLSVREHVEVWAGLKGGVSKKDINRVAVNLIDKCDLTIKSDTHSKNLSGGQKRKLQLAVMFVGGSNVCFIDEVSSGLDPISRRKIWDILLEHRQGTSQVLTTHFLDEADILSDKIAIVSKGQLKAEGSSVELKQALGGGTKIYVRNKEDGSEEIFEFHDNKDVLAKISELEKDGVPYRVASPELEDAFLQVAIDDHNEHSWEEVIACSKDMAAAMDSEFNQHVGLLQQSWTMFRKRVTIAKRSPLPEIVTFILPIIVAVACRGFLTSFVVEGCVPAANAEEQVYTFFNYTRINLVQGLRSAIQNRGDGLKAFAQNIDSRYSDTAVNAENLLGFLSNRTTYVDGTGTFRNYIENNYQNLYPGGVYLNDSGGDLMVAYKIDGADFGTFTGTSMLNYLNNMRLNGASTLIGNYSPFQQPFNNELGNSLQFALYLGLALAAAPAFTSLYPTFERLSNIRAMHYSNGLKVLPLWVSYLIFSTLLWIVLSAVLVGIIVGSNGGVIGAGYLFLVFLLYGISSTLASFVISTFAQSQLAAFASTAAYLAVCLLLYLIAYLSELTYGSVITIPRNLVIVQFTMSILGPSASLQRAIFVSLNMFGVLCDSNGNEITYLGNILAYGGCILYLMWQSILFFAILIWWDSGRYRFNLKFWKRKDGHSDVDYDTVIDSQNVFAIEKEIARVDESHEEFSDGLRVSHASKDYGSNRVCDDISFGVVKGECFALLGPNGAGKTTTFNMIRGEIWPTSGEVYVGSSPVTSDRSAARSKLGVCPQFDAMDKMTVVETLDFYGRLRGLKNVSAHVDRVITAVGVDRFRTRVAHKLSGGNKRKLSLGIALICNPLVLLLDEPSSGMDAFAKRIMWKTLAAVSHGRSIVLTTHSMEEADALADRAGFLAKRLLAVGETNQLRDVYGKFYHVHLICKTAPYTSYEEMSAIVEWIMQKFTGSMADDRLYQGQIRMKIPIAATTTIASLFSVFEEESNNLGIDSYSVSPTRLEEVFLQIVGSHNVAEEGYRQ